MPLYHQLYSIFCLLDGSTTCDVVASEDIDGISHVSAPTVAESQVPQGTNTTFFLGKARACISWLVGMSQASEQGPEAVGVKRGENDIQHGIPVREIEILLEILRYLLDSKLR